jgi:hypothetical protein
MHSRTADVAMSITIAAAGPGFSPLTIAGNGDTNLADNESNLTLVYSDGAGPSPSGP